MVWWSVVGRVYASFGLRPTRLRFLQTAWYPQVRDCCGLGGGGLVACPGPPRLVCGRWGWPKPRARSPGGGVPYCPWWGGPWGEHGFCPFDEPLWAGRRSRSGYNVVVPALEDCNPDLRRGLVTVCRWVGEVVVWGPEAGSAEGGVAGWCGGLFPVLRAVRVRWVVLLRWGPS